MSEARDATAAPTRRVAPWRADALQQRLAALLPGLTVEVVERTASTNTTLVDRARQAAARGDALPAPCLLVAETQTAGRGRQGKSWRSSAGASLTFSLALPLAPRDWRGLSLAVGVALAEALDAGPAGRAGTPDAQPTIGLKWPNDVWLLDAPGRGRKLAGILIETVAVGSRRLAVVGVGINVLLPPPVAVGAGLRADKAVAAAEVDTDTACVHEFDPAATPAAVLHRVAPGLVGALLAFERDGCFAPFATRFAARDLLRGQAVTTTSPACPAGVADGVDHDGSLRLRGIGGGRHRLESGEVSVRLGGSPADAPPAGGGGSRDGRGRL